MWRALHRWRPRRDSGEGATRAPFADLATPWDWAALQEADPNPLACNICGWSGNAFEGNYHSEAAICPGCGSSARNRFLFYCFIRRTSPGTYRVVETSPRLGAPYQQAMARWFDYRASDYDQRAHRTDLQLDLQDIALPGDSLDVLLTAHVLEHVPHTHMALREIHRILTPGGRMYLQVPLLQGGTAPPEEPELHGDSTPVFWRFGLDLTARLRETGFHTEVLCTESFYSLLASGAKVWPGPVSAEFDVDSILAATDTRDLVPVADEAVTRRLGFHPGYMFLTWEAAKSG